MPRFGGTACFPYPYGVVLDRVVQALGDLRWQVRHMDPAVGYILASISLTPLSWGENVAIQVYESPPGQTWVVVDSSSKFALIDWGKNHKNLDRLFAYLQQLLPAGGQAPVVVPPPQASISPEQPLAATACPRCRSTQPSGARFCVACGGSLEPRQESEPPAGPKLSSQVSDCPACGTENRAEANYCSGCGQALHPKFF
ncbi:MAG: zinc ribbon domain-containing protein [Actinobacteria bacterium]|nr:zinc ribbon domain-containing protein [Actinomycetota bacterium]MBU1943726.1 zinc ribbon domain-containing protein [Actinomycetota bacterium]MBU2687060.1 zinc ribbon domain-containing protein [Actinomycetota bacterium]